ncbi:FAD linked oxidase-like protein [Nitzschia inconspicua]|uniref:FAD linked oxidase-like protein n=1 Tax=Nitzschia inconspicua TaxID=303405 RepID=A0A9K3L4C9_9STRA|nr:FAD linked oxidase-like protein [Nitzschia inconspicua]
MMFNKRAVQSLVLGVSLAVATSIANDAPSIPTASSSTAASNAKRTIWLNSRRLEDVSGEGPTTCTDIPDGYDAFDVAAEEAFLSRNEDDDCHTMTGSQGSYQHPIDDVYPSIEETTRFELCLSNDQTTRYIFSNGLPDHTIFSPVERPTHCVVPYAVALPTNPVYDPNYKEEVPIAGPVAFNVFNGIPFVDPAWAVDNGFILTEEAWAGHANVRSFYWHYHTSRLPPNGNYPSQDELVGYAMDGFAIYGPLDNGAVSRQGLPLLLDECNGLVGDDGIYRYHMIRMEDIDFTAPMCNEQDPRVHNWKPVIGCFRGSTANSRVWLDDGNRDGMTCQTILDGKGPTSTTPDQPVEQPTGSGSQTSENLVACLEAITDAVVIDANDGDTYVSASQCHNSARTDRVWQPKAIVKAYTTQQVADAVKCAVAANVKVTPRSGAHGFENEACSGELIIDVSGLESLEVVGDASDRVVTFGSGHVHGQLYKKLSENYGWVVPGGTENSVGTAGLWLGCGRGPLTQIHGFTCDNMLAVEFVDAKGNIRVADANQDTDMFWMARGSGGEFPGIVTKFTVQAYDEPTEVWALKITFEANQIQTLIKTWSDRLETLSDPARSMFTSIVGFQGAPILGMTCFSCDESQKGFMKQQFDEITNAAGGGFGYNEWLGSWLDRLLAEDWDGYNTVEDLAVKEDWPEVWATLSNGGHLVYSSDEPNDAMLDVLQTALETYGDDFHLYLYSMIPSSSNTLLDTPYGGRDAKYIVHYKWIGSDTTYVKANLREISINMDNAGLQCKNFYNYADRSFPCAESSGEAWLEAHFSDVPRMQSIRAAEDPSLLFTSNFKLQKWDTNQYQYVGLPEVGDWGGTCTCPNGSVYWVGDNGDACASLACVGGVSGTCSEANAGGEGYRVVCDTSVTMAPTAPTTVNDDDPPVSVSAPIASSPSSPVSSPVAQLAPSSGTLGGGTSSGTQRPVGTSSSQAGGSEMDGIAPSVSPDVFPPSFVLQIEGAAAAGSPKSCWSLTRTSRVVLFGFGFVALMLVV